MSNQPSNRQSRRRRYVQNSNQYSKMELPGPLRVLTNPKVFVVTGIIFALAIVLGLLSGSIRGSNNTSGGRVPVQSGEAPDKPADITDASGTPLPASTPVPELKRFDAPPPLLIDPSKTYIATLKTPKGDIRIQLDAKAAPEAVNSFVFLARQGYYNNTLFMQLVAAKDGSRFVAQAGDPTGTGLGKPGFSVPKERTTAPFARGAVGMGGSVADSNGGQFFISYVDEPGLTGKYTIFGKVVSGLDVLDQLKLADVTQGSGPASGDKIVSVDITES